MVIIAILLTITRLRTSDIVSKMIIEEKQYISFSDSVLEFNPAVMRMKIDR